MTGRQVRDKPGKTRDSEEEAQEARRDFGFTLRMMELLAGSEKKGDTKELTHWQDHICRNPGGCRELGRRLLLESR